MFRYFSRVLCQFHGKFPSKVYGLVSITFLKHTDRFSSAVVGGCSTMKTATPMITHYLWFLFHFDWDTPCRTKLHTVCLTVQNSMACSCLKMCLHQFISLSNRAIDGLGKRHCAFWARSLTNVRLKRTRGSVWESVMTTGPNWGQICVGQRSTVPEKPAQQLSSNGQHSECDRWTRTHPETVLFSQIDLPHYKTSMHLPLHPYFLLPHLLIDPPDQSIGSYSVIWAGPITSVSNSD